MKYSGICKTSAGNYRCIIQWRKKVYGLGTATDEETAVTTRDRVARHLGCPERMLNLPGRRLKPMSVAEGKAKLARDARARKPHRYLGVQKTEQGTYRCVIQWRGEVHHLGTAAEEQAALVIRDRVARHLGCPKRMLNLPDRRLKPLSVEDAKATLKYGTKKLRTSRYLGVSRIVGSSLWQVFLEGKDGRIHLGRWPTERAAAIARDRATLHYRPDLDLNFPRMKLEPATADELLREARARRNKTTSSRFTGPYYDAGACPGRPWSVQLAVDGQVLFLGNWESEKDAAIAYDRAWLHYSGGTAPNLPRESKRAGAASAETLRDIAIKAKKDATSSRYFGVSWAKHAKRWEAFITIPPRKKVNLGLFDCEEAAARARDREALARLGDDIRLNFHPTTGEELRGRLPK